MEQNVFNNGSTGEKKETSSFFLKMMFAEFIKHGAEEIMLERFLTRMFWKQFIMENARCGQTQK